MLENKFNRSFTINHEPKNIRVIFTKEIYLGDEVKNFGKKVLLVYGSGSIKRIGLYDKIISELQKVGMEIFELAGVEPNPRHTTVNKGAKICKENNIEVLLAVGGGALL